MQISLQSFPILIKKCLQNVVHDLSVTLAQNVPQALMLTSPPPFLGCSELPARASSPQLFAMYRALAVGGP